MATGKKKVLVVGASGLVGAAAVAALRADGAEVAAISRRPPATLDGAMFVPADLNDREACAARFGALGDATHLVYAALHEKPALVAGWREDDQIATNDAMFRNVLDPLVEAKGALRHVTLLQGTKAYGVHVRPIPIPAREGRDEFREQPNFYWNQEDHLRETADGADWGWTILRPVLIVGGGVGGAMNLVPPIGVFAALLKEAGLPLAFPGGGPRITQAVDTDLLARAIAWAGEAEGARNRALNVTNGDVFVWEQAWPALAEALGMATGDLEPRSVEAYCRDHASGWDTIRDKYDLRAPALDEFVGPSLQYLDYALGHGRPKPGPPSIVSTVAIHEAGFHEVMDTEAMFRKWIERLQAERLLPPA